MQSGESDRNTVVSLPASGIVDSEAEMTGAVFRSDSILVLVKLDALVK